MKNVKKPAKITGMEAVQMHNLATQYILENLTDGPWPYDEWVGLGKNGEFDLNLWSEELKHGGQVKYAAVYKTIRGEKHNSTDTSRWVMVDVNNFLTEKATPAEITGEEAPQMENLAAQYILENHATGSWPYDEWISLGKNREFALNLWSEKLKHGGHVRYAAVYKTIHRGRCESTDTSCWLTVDVEKVLNEKSRQDVKEVGRF